MEDFLEDDSLLLLEEDDEEEAPEKQEEVTIKLDYTLKTMEERNALVEKLIAAA